MYSHCSCLLGVELFESVELYMADVFEMAGHLVVTLLGGTK